MARSKLDRKFQIVPILTHRCETRTLYKVSPTEHRRNIVCSLHGRRRHSRHCGKHIDYDSILDSNGQNKVYAIFTENAINEKKLSI